MPSRSYPALSVKQTSEAQAFVLFAAAATDIQQWAGIIQRQELSGQETVGFQRVESPTRVAQLQAFYRDGHNIVQNPLLCAARNLEQCTFEPGTDAPTDGPDVPGTVTISWPSLDEISLLDLLRTFEQMLRARLAEAPGEPPEELVTSLKEQAAIVHGDVIGVITESPGDTDSEDAGASDDDDDDDDDEDPSAESADVLFSEETHLFDFWQAVAARVAVLEDLGSFEGTTFLGFTKDAVAGYVLPVLLVDGQHRLLGAVGEASRMVDEDPTVMAEAAERVLAGEDADVVRRQLTERHARVLPVSLLMDPSPEEHVFQFVVVNQQATPIQRPLLGTIVATSLTDNELSSVSGRLVQAKIPLADAQDVAALTRDPNSPFAGLVQRGLASESGDLLAWSVLRSLVAIVRDLHGGRAFGKRNDYAEKWKRDHLPASGIVDVTDPDGAYLAWSNREGPWRAVFVRFFKAVRDQLADTEDQEAGNYWGRPRDSNLFNKISLTILTADFFAFLTERKYAIDSEEEIEGFVTEWLDGVSTRYFSRDWPLEGIKRDSVGIRNQWADLWFEYRRDPVRLPSVTLFRQPKGA